MGCPGWLQWLGVWRSLCWPWLSALILFFGSLAFGLAWFLVVCPLTDRRQRRSIASAISEGRARELRAAGAVLHGREDPAGDENVDAGADNEGLVDSARHPGNPARGSARSRVLRSSSRSSRAKLSA